LPREPACLPPVSLSVNFDLIGQLKIGEAGRREGHPELSPAFHLLQQETVAVLPQPTNDMAMAREGSCGYAVSTLGPLGPEIVEDIVAVLQVRRPREACPSTLHRSAQPPPANAAAIAFDKKSTQDVKSTRRGSVVQTAQHGVIKVRDVTGLAAAPAAAAPTYPNARMQMETARSTLWNFCPHHPPHEVAERSRRACPANDESHPAPKMSLSEPWILVHILMPNLHVPPFYKDEACPGPPQDFAQDAGSA
jgi:hypothetical protein